MNFIDISIQDGSRFTSEFIILQNNWEGIIKFDNFNIIGNEFTQIGHNKKQLLVFEVSSNSGGVSFENLLIQDNTFSNYAFITSTLEVYFNNFEMLNNSLAFEE